MKLFSSKQIKDDIESAEENPMLSKISTMQDDLAGDIIKKNKRRTLTENFRFVGRKTNTIQRDLASVYTNEDGTIPDLTKLETGDKPFWQKLLYFLTISLFILLISAIAGFWVYSNFTNDTFTNEKITFKIEPPIAVVAGQEQDYRILITNKEKVNLYNLNIELQYPEGFEYVSSTIQSGGEKNNLWDFSVLKVGESKEIVFTAKLTAGIGSVNSLSGTLTFKPENLNADFKQKDTVDLGVNSSVVSLSLEGPEKILANQKIDYKIKLNNFGKDILNDLEVVATYPQRFSYEKASIEPKDGSDNIWEISNLATSSIETTATSSVKEIIISGNYSAIDDSGDHIFSVIVNSKNKLGEKIVLAEQTFNTAVVRDQLKLSLVINGSGQDQPIGFGETLFYTLSYKNASTEEIKNIELVAFLDSQLLDWSAISEVSGGKIKDNKITWTGKEISKLLSLRAQEEGEITWTIRVKDLEDINRQTITKFSIENKISASFKNVNNESSEVTLKPIINSINSDLSLSAQARYYNDDNLPLGAGPITPKIGEPSSYNIKIDLANNLHDIANIVVSLSLPKNVSWDDKDDVDTGSLVYDRSAHKVLWRISKLSKTAKGASANFNVSITPQESDFGRVLVLVPEIKLSAKDIDVGSDINKTVRAITTAFDDPILGKLSGVVE